VTPPDAQSPDVPAIEPERRLGGPLFWMTAVAGWCVIAYGVRGLLQHHVDTRPADLAKFFVGGALLHDLVFAPLVLLAGVLLARTVRGRARSVVQAALVISCVVALFSYPLVRNYAKVLHNPSSLPHDYAANLAAVLGVVWGIAVIWSLAAVLVRRPFRRTSATEVSATREDDV
jgi:hypothetical protein